MRTIFGALIGATAAFLLVAIGCTYFGTFSVAATEPHWPVTHWFMSIVRDRSIAVRASWVQVPPDLDKDELVLVGTDHFAAHCAVCHGAPGVPKGDIAKGLYPAAPNLAETAPHYRPNELFWILKNGIKMTGMPAWNDHSDEELWATVAFLRRLPSLSEPDYAKLIMATMNMPGHHH